MSTAVELVLAELESAGFQRLPRPLVVGGAVFDFDAAVAGTGVSHDLVVVGGQGANSAHLVQLLSGLNRSLDRFASRRPVSLVLIGSRPEPEILADLEDNARIMVIEGELPEPTDIQDAIAVLLPLRLPPTTREVADPLDELVTDLGRSTSDEHRVLIDAARIGPEAVQEAFRSYLDQALEDTTEQGEGEEIL